MVAIKPTNPHLTDKSTIVLKLLVAKIAEPNLNKRGWEIKKIISGMGGDKLIR